MCNEQRLLIKLFTAASSWPDLSASFDMFVFLILPGWVQLIAQTSTARQSAKEESRNGISCGSSTWYLKVPSTRPVWGELLLTCVGLASSGFLTCVLNTLRTKRLLMVCEERNEKRNIILCPILLTHFEASIGICKETFIYTRRGSIFNLTFMQINTFTQK